MEQNKLMEGLNENTQVYGGVSNSKGGIVTKLALGALGIAAGVGAVLFLKKKKAKNNSEEEFVDSDVYEDCDDEQ